MLNLGIGLAQSKMLLASMQQGNPPVYFANNAATPTPNEVAGTDGWSLSGADAAKVTLSVEGSDVHNGSSAIKVLCNTDIVSGVNIDLSLTGLTPSTSYTIECYVKRGAGNVNLNGVLRNTNGWSSTVTSSTINPATYTLVSLTGTTTGTTATFTIVTTTTFDATDFILIDTITITQN